MPCSRSDLSIVAALDEDRVIGRGNALPWRLGPDLRRFRRVTMGRPVIMGRRTHESIGRALDGRTNIVVTRRLDYGAQGCVIVHGLDDALARCAGEEAMVIGGAEIYAQTISRARRMYLTLVHARFDGDARFPPFDAGDWREIDRDDHDAGDGAEFAYSFVTLDRLESEPPGAL